MLALFFVFSLPSPNSPPPPPFPLPSFPPTHPHLHAPPAQNLDLIVTPPVGPVAYGNANLPPTGGQQTQGNLANGTSTGQIPDTLNNVERLKFPVPAGGWTAAPYLVQVRGTAVPIGGSQRYSLVVTGPGIVISYGLPCTAPPLEEQQSPFSNSTHTAKW